MLQKADLAGSTCPKYSHGHTCIWPWHSLAHEQHPVKGERCAINVFPGSESDTESSNNVHK